MVSISDKRKCCGCSACVQVCPKQCISFDEDEQGFRYPIVNNDICINCGLCEKVCLYKKQNDQRKPLKIYGAINPNETVRLGSSSGGIFTMLAEAVIDESGVVFGASFDSNWQVEHTYTRTKTGIAAFRGSKYVQSRIGEAYKQAQAFLNEGYKVLFSGTSCQIAALKNYLRRDYENLLTIDVVCHGVPSPLVWRDYLETVKKRPKGVDGKNTVLSSLKDTPVITGISFRDKSTGWKKYGFVIRGKSAFVADENSVLTSDINSNEKISEDNNVFFRCATYESTFMKSFLYNLSLRPSCFDCPAKMGKSGADISLADFWSVDRYCHSINDDKGVTLVYALSERGLSFINSISKSFTELDNNKVYNSSFNNPPKEKFPIDMFWKSYQEKGLECVDEICKKMEPNFMQVLMAWGRQTIKRIIYR